MYLIYLLHDGMEPVLWAFHYQPFSVAENFLKFLIFLKKGCDI